MSLLPSARPELEKYELLEELGHGAMATVYRAIDRRLGREVAVKIIHRHLRGEGEVGARLTREARAVAKLRHPYIVEVFDVSEPDDSERYLVVELVQGPTLRQVLREHSPMPPEIAAVLGMQIAEGLAHAHGRGVVHRDIKPENVLLSIPGRVRFESERAPSDMGAPSTDQLPARERESRADVEVVAKLTDFGIAKVLDAQGVTSTGEVLGSPAHMAPEQIEGHDVGPGTDIFALGVLLYEAMVGRLPFEGSNPAQVLRRVLEGQFVPVDRAAPTVGSGFGAIVNRCLAHEPEQRFASAREVADALEAELARLGFGDTTGELTQYFKDREGFLAAYEPRLVEVLRREAERARKAGEVTMSAALFNRALAMRPSDAELLAEVTRATRQRRRGTTLRYGLLGTGILGALLALLALVRPVPTSAPLALKPKGGGSGVPQGPTQVRQPAATSSAPPLATGGGALERAIPSARPPVRVPPPRPEQADSTSTRTVQVVVSGVAGSRMLIDGEERRWFGTRHELALGTHRFEAVPPNDTCCIVPEPKLVEVRPGEGVLKVHLKVQFREAQIQLAAAAGSTLSCGELFPEILTSPGRRAVRVSKAETVATCTLVPPPDSDERPRSVAVVLRPGSIFTVAGP